MLAKPGQSAFEKKQEENLSNFRVTRQKCRKNLFMVREVVPETSPLYDHLNDGRWDTVEHLIFELTCPSCGNVQHYVVWFIADDGEDEYWASLGWDPIPFPTRVEISIPSYLVSQWRKIDQVRRDLDLERYKGSEKYLVESYVLALGKGLEYILFNHPKNTHGPSTLHALWRRVFNGRVPSSEELWVKSCCKMLCDMRDSSAHAYLSIPSTTGNTVTIDSKDFYLDDLWLLDALWNHITRFYLAQGYTLPSQQLQSLVEQKFADWNNRS